MDVVPLRKLGVKLPRAYLPKPVRGHVSLTATPYGEKFLRQATVRGAYGKARPLLLPDLTRAFGARITEQGIIVCGFEIIDGEDFRQAWWCWPVLGEPDAPIGRPVLGSREWDSRPMAEA